jgi:quercetin dioxygenase-like cupin family protein
MTIVNLNAKLKQLKKFNDEIRHADCFKTDRITSGLVAFRPNKNSDPKQINHDDKDVVCQVIKGKGRLRVNGKRIVLKPGIVCHIPKGTLHDFAAAKGSELVLFYLLIQSS